jgi:hypothetical protein
MQAVDQVKNDWADFGLGVDACNTALGVLIFAAAMNLGNSWMTILSLFGCKLPRPRWIIESSHLTDFCSSDYDLLCPDLG